MRVGRVPRVKGRYYRQHLAFIKSLNMKIPQGSLSCSWIHSGEDEMTPSAFRDRAKMAFNYADANSDGSLSRREYIIAMTAVFGCRPDKIEVRQVFQAKDRILYDEFERHVCKKGLANHLRVNADVLFSLLDKNYKGYLVLDDFCSASKSIDFRVPSSVWRIVFKELDRYRKGYIDLDEFLRVFPAA